MTQKEKPFAIHISDSNISEICKRVMKKYESKGERKQDTLKKIMLVAMNSKEGQYRYVENLNPVYDIIDRLTGQMNAIVDELIKEKEEAEKQRYMEERHRYAVVNIRNEKEKKLNGEIAQQKQEIQNQKEKYNNIEEKYNFAKKLVNELEEKLEKYKGLEEKYDLLEKEYKELSKKYNEQVLELARIKS